ncbi:gamma-glutamyltransferase [Pelagibius marinus]|uniref:gamma-glutamyltransferase n=1 Tax=Pelagibius marinus TaxID=2762760 RepID=UPI00187322A7|nr:gamma-glutamyltransferase [Pelagibius marinus]
MRDFDFPGRSTVHACNGMAATSHPLATGVAIDVLRKGGNALDAAIAASATLAVVEPQSTGIGGDCFALMCLGGSEEVIGFNGSGRAPAAAALDLFLKQGMREIEATSVHAVTMPGAIDAWTRLHETHGWMDFSRLLAPAIAYARGGYPVHARVRFDWLRAANQLRQNEAARAVFLPRDQVPGEGDLHCQPALAETLAKVAAGGRRAFYEGEIAEAMTATLRAAGGCHVLEDFAAVQGEYVTPICTDYRGIRVHQIPPNNQGLTALIMLNILEGFDLQDWAPLSAERTHLEAEAGRLAFAARNAAIADPASMTAKLERLLSKDWAGELRSSIRLDRPLENLPDLGLRKSDTVYVCVVDRDLNAVSFINSIYDSFGSAILCPQTGVLFQNRGRSFRLDADHPNCIGPSKRPMHTIMPGMVTRAGRALMPYGVMGGDYQPFGHTRLLTNVFDYGLDVQAALDMPRVFAGESSLELEKSFPAETIRALLAIGHDVRLAPEPLGGGQAILIDHGRGILSGGSDPRKDGCALGY